MKENTRKDKKIARKRRIKFFLAFLVLLFFSVSGAYLYIVQKNRPLYISPLAKMILGDSSTKSEGDQKLIKNSFKALHLDIDKISETNDAYVILLKDKSQIILSSKKNITSQISSLQFILARLTMEGKLFTQLDLRFDKPVIRLKL